MDIDSQVISFKEIAERIASDPYGWVLFLGHGISYHESGYRRRRFIELAKEIEQNTPDRSLVEPVLCRAVRSGEYTELSSVLFGDICDSASFLDSRQEKQRERRKKYAQTLAKKEEINIDVMNMHLENLLAAFSGIIMTTCQDETVEAFLEYTNSMSTDGMVCTPYTMTTSSTWDRWIKKDGGDISRLFSQVQTQADSHILVKLYGTRSMPHRMVLSMQDFKTFYPSKNDIGQEAVPQTQAFLKAVLRTKNILFIGVDFSPSCTLPLAEGILEVLKESTDKERYAFAPKCSEKKQESDKVMKACQIKLIGDDDCISRADSFLSKEKVKIPQAPAEGEAHNALSKEEDILELFGRGYIRRTYKGIFPKDENEIEDSYEPKDIELEVLKEKILGIGRADCGERKWSETSIRQLAIAANNLADFYDLEKVFAAACKAVEAEAAQQGRDSDPVQFYETVTRNILNDRLSPKSQQLRQILSVYGDGFPFGFLQLLSEDETELKEWKQAGIRLANSGMYIKRNYRKYVQKRMSYADSVMQTAGAYPDDKRMKFKSRMEESCHQVINSYFYPVDSQTKGSIQDEQIKKYFVKMLKKLLEILKDQSEGYHQIHSLLQTETKTIVDIIEKMEDESLKWKPSLFYYLLLESRMIPSNCSVPQMKDLINQLDNIEGQNNSQIFSSRLELNMAVLIIMTQSLGGEGMDEEDNEAQEKEKAEIMEQCQNIEDMIEKQEALYTQIIPEQLFRQHIQFLFLKSRMYGHLSTIIEIKRCKARDCSSEGQINELKLLKETLDDIDRLIKERKNLLDCSYEDLTAEYNFLKGEYHFKMSQYYWENRQFKGQESKGIDSGNDGGIIIGPNKEETKNYEYSENCYESALEYYSKYPSRFEIQRADVMRNLADLYCQQRIGHRKKHKKDQKAETLQEKLYDLLIEAYVLYRNNSDLHGIADVLQSMGNAEIYQDGKKEEKCRSPFCFHKAAVDIYEYLGDAWSRFVVLQFQKGVYGDRMKRNQNVK